MQILIPPNITAQFLDGLTQAGQREIGGILMGEHISTDTFRVTKITVQRKGGTFARFVRIVGEILGPLREFFESTRHDYTRHNYMGEWHSHHSFALSPSDKDHATMYSMVTDKDLGAHFAVLLLVKLGQNCTLDATVTLYQPNKPPRFGSVVWERQKSEIDSVA
jgi:[CysO sulfur-carrier protein]-S-L-cysteine hydrolase